MTASNGVEIGVGDRVRVVGNRALHPPSKRPVPNAGRTGIVTGVSPAAFPVHVEFLDGHSGFPQANYRPEELEVVDEAISLLPRRSR